MFTRRSSKMPLRFHVNGIDHSGYIRTTPSSTTTSSSSLPIKRFSMFQNLQNSKPCGSCGGK